MRKFQPMQRMRQFINRSKKRKAEIQMRKNGSSIMPLLVKGSAHDVESHIESVEDIQTRRRNYDDDHPLTRSPPSERHLKTDGSSFDQLRKLCQKLPDCTHEQRSSSSKSHLRGRSANDFSKFTEKSDFSSGRQLQMILEKLIDDESVNERLQNLDRDRNNIQNSMDAFHVHEKQVNPFYYNTKYNDTMTATKKNVEEEKSEQKMMTMTSTQNEETLSQASNNIRYEMLDPNEQAKLFLNTRKRNNKNKNYTKRQQSSRKQDTLKRNGRILRDYSSLVPALEIKSNSMYSLSSCSIDSALDETIDTESFTSDNRHHHHRRERESNFSNHSKYFESISCQAGQWSEDLKAVLVDSYGFASSWFACINLQADDL